MKSKLLHESLRNIPNVSDKDARILADDFASLQEAVTELTNKVTAMGADIAEIKTLQAKAEEKYKEIQSQFKIMSVQINERYKAMQEQLKNMYSQANEHSRMMQAQADNWYKTMQIQAEERFKALQVQANNQYEIIQNQTDKRHEALRRKIAEQFAEFKTYVTEAKSDLTWRTITLVLSLSPAVTASIVFLVRTLLSSS